VRAVVCLPTYNERENLEPMVRALGEVLPEDGRVLVNLGVYCFQTTFLVQQLVSDAKKKTAHDFGKNILPAALDRGGLEPGGADLAAFRAALLRERHTLKRALTDPRLFSGIGNAYSDEILHRARLSPVALTSSLSDAQIAALHEATLAVLAEWTERLRREAAGGFPEGVTAFREEMAVHGRHRRPCPVCGTAVQRIVRAENEVNYCPRCQTGGRILSDRSLARLLKEDWPRTIEELERNPALGGLRSAPAAPRRRR